MTTYYHPRISFLAYSCMGIVVAVIGSYLDESEEHEEDENQQNEGFCAKLARNLGQITSAIIMPEMYLVVLYFIISGLFSPDFGDFGYYFMLNVAGISKF